MEYPTFFTAGSSFLFNRWPLHCVRLPEETIIHELAHQYWYGLVASNEFEEAWLDEGFATYATALTMERAWPPHGNVIEALGLHLGSLEMAQLGNGPGAVFDPIRRPAWRYSSGNSYGFNSYYRSELALRTLGGLLGEETMARVMRTYHERWRFGHPASEDFYAVAEEVAGRDLDGFFSQLVEDSALVDIEVARRSSRRLAPDRAGCSTAKAGARRSVETRTRVGATKTTARLSSRARCSCGDAVGRRCRSPSSCTSTTGRSSAGSGTGRSAGCATAFVRPERLVAVTRIQENASDIFSLFMNVSILLMIPWYLYSNKAGVKQDQAIEPGKGIECDDPGAVVFPTWRVDLSSILKAIEIFFQLHSQTGNIGDVQTGQAETSKADVKATEIMAMVQESNIKFNYMSNTVRDDFIDLLKTVYDLYYQNMPYDYTWKYQGQEVPIPRPSMRRKLKFRLTGSTELSNKLLERKEHS